MKLYKAFEQAKNGTGIPVFQSGRTMESRYNPERDAQNLCDSIDKNNKFFLVLGIGSGIFIRMLSQIIPGARIIAFELYKEDLDFLLQNPEVKKLSENPDIIFSDLSNLEKTLTQNYLPAKYGNLKIIEQKAWINEIASNINEINSILKKTLGIISADYSVQAHFGKIWNSNILNNAKTAEKQNTFSFNETIKNSLNKTAVIVAAGPTLDKSIEDFLIKADPEKYFVIATDTAASSLIKRNVFPDIVVSIDGQSVSYNHFINTEISTKKEIIYAFDLCANSSAVRHIYEDGRKLLFFCSGHPLSTAINSCCGSPLITLFSGAGTVTITAVDLAVKAGFKDIIILGADFSYSNGKAYTSGTYLDVLYNSASSKLFEAEGSFSRLMFRTELIALSENIKTTQILQAYKYSFEKYLQANNIEFKKEKNIYKLTNQNSGASYFKIEKKTFSLKAFFEKLKACPDEEAEMILLPYIAWLRNNELYKNLSYKELVKLALESIVSYNI